MRWATPAVSLLLMVNEATPELFEVLVAETSVTRVSPGFSMSVTMVLGTGALFASVTRNVAVAVPGKVGLARAKEETNT